MTLTGTTSPDVLVLGGGLVGSAVAYGLAREGARVTVLDEDDGGFRASRGNFGLVWIQGKGYGLSPYARWSRKRSWATTRTGCSMPRTSAHASRR